MNASYSFSKLLIVPMATVALLAIALNADAAFTRQLEMGMSGSDVAELQTVLAADPSVYPEGLITGYFGPLTRAAVIRYQQKNGISAVGRVGPITLAALRNPIGGADDVFAPSMSASVVASSTMPVTVSWTTNEPARSRVMYGTSWPFLYATAPSVSTQGFGTNHNVSLSGLASGTTYFYVRESVDQYGNVMLTMPEQVRTP